MTSGNYRQREITEVYNRVEARLVARYSRYASGAERPLATTHYRELFQRYTYNHVRHHQERLGSTRFSMWREYDYICQQLKHAERRNDQAARQRYSTARCLIEQRLSDPAWVPQKIIKPKSNSTSQVSFKSSRGL